MTKYPRWLYAPFVVGAAFLALPLLGMFTRVNWTQLLSLLASEPALDALRLSLITCLISTGIVLILGLPLALVLARSNAWWAKAVRMVVTVPMVLPPVVAGLALLVTFGRMGLVGKPLSGAGIEIGYTTFAVILAQTFIALPYLVVSCEGALRGAGLSYERVAANLGASPSRVLWRVTLPGLLPAIAAGAALSFARALGEFGATLTFAGSLQGVTRTLPLQVYLLRESDSDLALALAVVLIVIALAVAGISTRLQVRGSRV